MGYSWMVDERVCDHLGNELNAYKIQRRATVNVRYVVEQ